MEKYFKLISSHDEGKLVDVSFVDEKTLRDLANYYLDNSDYDWKEVDYHQESLEEVIKFVQLVDEVIEIDEEEYKRNNAPAGEDEDIKAMKDFLEHAEKSVIELVASEEEYQEKFNLKLSMNGKEISMPMHADLYHRLIEFVKSEIEENQL